MSDSPILDKREAGRRVALDETGRAVEAIQFVTAESEVESTTVLAARRGERGAFECLVQRYWKSVYRIAYHLVSDSEEAADLAQETFLSAWESIHRLRDSSSFRAWLFRMTVNRSLNAARRKKRQRAMCFDHESGALTMNEKPLDAWTDSLAVRSALSKLGPKYRVVLVMKYVEDLSYQEIGQALNLTRAGVDARLREARRQMQELLKEEGVR